MYGIFILLGILIPLLLVEKIAKKKSLNVDELWGMAFWSLVFGIVGARLYHVIDYWELYSKNPLAIASIWNGGMGIFGGIAGGFAGLVWYCKTKKLRMWMWADTFAVVIPLGQAIGRWGNYFNNEILPYSVYESALDLLLFLFIYAIKDKIKKSGIIFYLYITGYSIIRVVLEPFRIDPWKILGLNVAQSVSILLIVVSVIGIWSRYAKKAE